VSVTEGQSHQAGEPQPSWVQHQYLAWTATAKQESHEPLSEDCYTDIGKLHKWKEKQSKAGKVATLNKGTSRGRVGLDQLGTLN